jgi:hypothetical protein
MTQPDPQTTYPWREHAQILARIKQEEKHYGW